VAASRPGRFTSGVKTPSSLGIGGWVGPKVGLDATVYRKVPGPTGN